MMHDSFDDFDEQFAKTKKLALGGAIFMAALWIGVLGFVVWVIIKVLGHFAII